MIEKLVEWSARHRGLVIGTVMAIAAWGASRGLTRSQGSALPPSLQSVSLHEFGGEVRASYGNYEHGRIEGVVSIPATEHLRFKIGGSQDWQREGFMHQLNGSCVHRELTSRSIVM